MGPAPSLLCSAIPLQHLTAMLGAHAAATGLGPADAELFLPSGRNAEWNIAPSLTWSVPDCHNLWRHKE